MSSYAKSIALAVILAPLVSIAGPIDDLQPAALFRVELDDARKAIEAVRAANSDQLTLMGLT